PEWKRSGASGPGREGVSSRAASGDPDVAWAVLDTSVYIEHWERRRYEKELGAVRNAYVIRHSAVVLSELRRGARTPAARRLVEDLLDRKSTRLNSSHEWISYAVF